MPILDTTTCIMACLAALGDSPNLFPFSSVTGMPYFSSLNDTDTGWGGGKEGSFVFFRGIRVWLGLTSASWRGCWCSLQQRQQQTGQTGWQWGGDAAQVGDHQASQSKTLLSSSICSQGCVTYRSQRLQSQSSDHGPSGRTDVGGAKLTAKREARNN